MNERGIVVSPPFSILPSGGIQCGGDPSPLEMRKYLLYWDKIDYPDNNLVSVHSDDIDALMQLGVLERTFVRFQGEFNTGNGEFFIAAQEKAFSIRSELFPGSWSMAQLSTTPFYTQGERKTSIDFELYGALPVPSASTPFYDILQFKEHRSDELLAFRAHLDDVYQKILNSPDSARARNTEIERLESAIHSISRTLDESRIKKAIGSLRSTIQSEPISILGMGATFAFAAPAIIPMSPFIAGPAAVGITIAFKSMITPSRGTNSELTYLKSSMKNFDYKR